MILSRDIPPIYFYFPVSKLGIKKLPQNTDSYWHWQCHQHSISPMQDGGCVWTLQTYLYLNDRGFPCKLVETMPDEGIVISHHDYLDDSFQPGARLLLVCIRADRDRHPYAQLHVVQNPRQAISRSLMTLWESHFIPFWPQPALIPRDPQRGDKFENVSFLGNEINLVREFCGQDWYEYLKNSELKFQKKLNHNEWRDYSNVDVILAIRSFGRQNDWRGKPASKLYNGWHAGVPVILSHESAFQAERKSDLDYLEATSLAEVISSLTRLQKDRGLRRAMIENGYLRAKETQPDNMVKKWQDFLINVAVPNYKRWCNMPRRQQQLFFGARRSFVEFRPAYYQLKSQLANLSSI